ncbi:carboxylate-amine ligase [Roseospirillum parvum]|uniref:Putative glutamate--cysteine ligase 2 n=1 Tax=Roseospirillum parvum TaxID=83401 RepID=A0A1G7Y6W4_9PROT|nr:carboxylate-amine ligase [Roseospirillum parvum]SDG92063.1 carboxylate-amine ligase [Roseospirillum parvum]
MANLHQPAFTIGVEEEYYLVDPATGDLATDPPEEMMKALEGSAVGVVGPEFLRCQLEIATPVCGSVGELKRALTDLRGMVGEVTGRYGLAPVAASTHPVAAWDQQQHTDKERYNFLANDLQGVARRLLINGMHVHVGLEDSELRIDLMNQITYFLPHLLALSTSSPFWRGRDTGLMSYRLSVFDELPRTGLPQVFDSYGEYERHIEVLTHCGVIEDASRIWWDARPSVKFPTLEMRITDVCTRVEDAIAIAALYVCVLRMLYRLRVTNQRWRMYGGMLINENRWRAQRYGLDEGMIDFGRGEIVPYGDLLEELLDLVAEDAEALGAEQEVAAARDILSRGTSAHMQRRVYRQALAEGCAEEVALKRVVQHLVAATVGRDGG